MRVCVTISERQYQHSHESYHLAVHAGDANSGAVVVSFLFPKHSGGHWECARLEVGKPVARWLGQQLLSFADSGCDEKLVAAQISHEYEVKELPDDENMEGQNPFLED